MFFCILQLKNCKSSVINKIEHEIIKIIICMINNQNLQFDNKLANIKPNITLLDDNNKNLLIH